MAKILYLEDEKWQVEGTVITIMEKEYGHDVTLVQTVEIAHQNLMDTSYDIVILDIMTNSIKGIIDFDESGFKIAKLLLDGKYEESGNSPETPIVIASGVWDMTIREANGDEKTVLAKAREMGIKNKMFLRKPFTVDELEAIFNLIILGEHKNGS